MCFLCSVLRYLILCCFVVFIRSNSNSCAMPKNRKYYCKISQSKIWLDFPFPRDINATHKILSHCISCIKYGISINATVEDKSCFFCCCVEYCVFTMNANYLRHISSRCTIPSELTRVNKRNEMLEIEWNAKNDKKITNDPKKKVNQKKEDYEKWQRQNKCKKFWLCLVAHAVWQCWVENCQRQIR